MTIGRGESVGEAYIRILADGRGLSRSIRDAADDGAFTEQGKKSHAAYQEGWDKAEEDNPTLRNTLKEMRGRKGEFDQTGNLLAHQFGKSFEKALQDELGDKRLGTIMADNFRRDLLREKFPELDRAVNELSRAHSAALRDNEVFNRRILTEERKAQAEGNKIRLAGEREAERIRRAGLKDTEHDVDELGNKLSELEKAFRFIQNKDFGKFFGQGNRNNFINSFGNLVGLVARPLAGLVVGSLLGLEKIGKGLKDTGEDAESFGKKFGGAISGLAGKLVNGLGALSAGALALPVLLKVALIGIQVFIGPLAALITDLAGAVVALASTIGIGLVGAVGAALPLIAPLVLGVATLALAFSGLTAAQKKALGVEFGPLSKQFKELRNDAREGIFGKGNSNIKAEVSALKPVLAGLDKLITSTGGALAKGIIIFTKGLGGKEFKAFELSMGKFVPDAIVKFSKIGTQSFLGITGLIKTLVPFAERLLNDMVRGTSAFEKFTNSKSGQDRITKFFTGAMTSAHLLWVFLVDIGKVLGDLLSGGKATGDELFGSINKSLEKFDSFLNSARGRKALQGFFDQTKTFLGALGKLVGGFGKFFGALNNGQSQNILNTLLSGLGGLLVVIAKNVPTAIPLIKDFASGMTAVFKALGAVASFVAAHNDLFKPIIVSLGALFILSKIGFGAGGTFGLLRATVGQGLLQLSRTVVLGADSISSAGGKLRGAIGGLAILGASSAIAANVKGAGGAATGLIGGALGGAIIGSGFGPIGAAVGGILGGTLGLVSHFWGNANKAAEDAKNKQIAFLNAIAAAADSLSGSIAKTGTAYTEAAKQQVIANLSLQPKDGGPTAVQIAQSLHIDTKTLADAVGGNEAALRDISTRQLDAINIAHDAAEAAKAKLNADSIKFGPASAIVANDQNALDAATKAWNKQKDAVDALNVALGIESGGLKKVIIDNDNIAAGTGKLNLATRDLADQVLAYGTNLDAANAKTGDQQVALQRDTQFIADHAAALGKSKVVQDALKKSVKDGALAYIDQTKSLEASLVQAGFAKPVVDSLIAKYGTIPKSLRTQIIADASKLPPVVQAALVNLGLIPPTKSTKLVADNQTAAGLAAANNAVKRFADESHQATLEIIPIINNRLLQNQISNLRSSLADVHLTASGGKFDGAQLRVIGEAGPEAVVPLRRPLSQVDPSVRALSAMAQGLPYSGGGVKSMANGGSVGHSGASNGPTYVLQDGSSIFSTPSTNPEAVVAEFLAHSSRGGY